MLTCGGLHTVGQFDEVDGIHSLIYHDHTEQRYCCAVKMRLQNRVTMPRAMQPGLVAQPGPRPGVVRSLVKQCMDGMQQDLEEFSNSTSLILADGLALQVFRGCSRLETRNTPSLTSVLVGGEPAQRMQCWARHGRFWLGRVGMCTSTTARPSVFWRTIDTGG